MKKSWRSCVILAAALSLGAGVVFSLPQTARADTGSCLAGILFSKTKSTATKIAADLQQESADYAGEISAGASGIAAVPVADQGTHDMISAEIKALSAQIKADSSINASTASSASGSVIQRCIVEPLVTIMARALLENFTAKTVQWINSGFQGSPMYVTNVQGFLSDAADQAIGQYIAGLGPLGQILCGPFDIQLRLSLGLQYGGSDYYQVIGCRLSDIQQNIQRAFTKGTFGANGWDNWIKMTAIPQNNPYGAYLKAVDAIDLKIGNTQFALKSQLDFGKGFLSSVDPKTGRITTPGSVIESQLANTLGEPVRQVGMAKDIDAILNALVGQLINQVMGGIGGLLGASSPPSGGGLSAVDRANNQTIAAMIAQNEQAQTLPDGLIMNTGTGTLKATGSVNGPTPTVFCAQFNKNIYGTQTGDVTGKVYVKVNGTGSAMVTSKNGGGSWTQDDYTRVASFCPTVGMTTTLNDATTDYTKQTSVGDTGGSAPNNGPTPTTTPTPANRRILLATAALNQSYTYNNTLTASNAAVGSGYGYSDTWPTNHGWWTASLNTSEQIETIQVYSDNGYGDGCTVTLANLPTKMGVTISPSDVQATAKVMEFKIDSNVNKSEFNGHKLPVSGLSSSGIPDNLILTLATPVTANAIMVSCDGRLRLSAVKMFRPEGATTPAVGGTVTPTTAFQNADSTAVSSYEKGTQLSDNQLLNNNQALSGLKASVRLLKQDGATQSLSAVFDSFRITATPTQNGQEKNYTASAADLNNLAWVYESSLSLTAANSLLISEVGQLKRDAASGTYRLITEIKKTETDGTVKAIATHTTTFTVQ